MTRILFTADSHLGYRQYRDKQRQQDFLDAFSQVIDEAIIEDVDAFVHAGDLFHSKNPGVTTLTETISQIERLETAQIPMLAVVGNHEMKRDSQFLDLISKSCDSLVRLDQTEWKTDDVIIRGHDYVPRHRWPPQFETNERTTVYVMHQLFSQITPPHYDPIPIEDVSVDGLDLVLAGDLHRRETMKIGETRVHYPGSTEKTSRSEADVKRVSIIEFDDEEIDIRQTQIETRSFVEETIRLTEDDGMNRLLDRCEAIDIEESIVHLTVRGDSSISQNQIEGIFESEGAMICEVIDERSIEFEEPETIDEIEGVEDQIETMIEEMDLHGDVREIEEIVRDTEQVKKSHVRRETKEILD